MRQGNYKSNKNIHKLVKPLTHHGLNKNFNRYVTAKLPMRESYRTVLPEMDSLSRSHRLFFLCGILCFVSVIITARMYYLQGYQNAKWNEIADRQHRTQVSVLGARGDILDAEGRTLAASVQTFAVGAHLHKIIDFDFTAKKLSDVLEIDYHNVLAQLKSDKSFVYISRGVSYDKKEQVLDLGLQGISLFDEFKRFYPQGDLAGVLLGRVGRDGNGLSGLELAYDKQLSADSFTLPVRRDARGHFLMASGKNEPHYFGFINASFGGFLNSKDKPEYVYDLDREGEAYRREGWDMQLSIDSVIQGIVESELRRGHEETKALKVFGMIMDAETGETLAMSQSPGFDPNRVSDVIPSDLRNGVLQDSFEPGSTLKPIVAAAALDQKLVSENETMNCENGRYHVGKYIVKDVHPIGVVSFRDVLVRSSNVCMTKIGQRMGKEKLHEALRYFGFGDVTGIELPGEQQGILRDHRSWAQIDVATHSFGQGVSVTALQLVQSYAALANGGKLVRPTIIKRKAGDNIPSYRVLSENTANKIKEILRGVTEDDHGTGTKSKISGVEVSGKTGTAQKARAGSRGYEADKVIGSFIGFIDGNEIGINRKLVMLVSVDEPGVRPRWGGVVAAPIFRRSMERVLSYLISKSEVRTVWNGEKTKNDRSKKIS